MLGSRSLLLCYVIVTTFGPVRITAAPSSSTIIPDGEYMFSGCAAPGNSTFCKATYEFTEESDQQMLATTASFGNSATACAITVNSILKYNGSAVEVTANDCISKVTKGSMPSTECTCDNMSHVPVTYQFSVDANTGVVTLSEGGQSSKLTPTKGQSTRIPDGKYTCTPGCAATGPSTFCKVTYEFTEESDQQMLALTESFGNSAMACDTTVNFIVKYDGSAVELTENGDCIPKVTKGSTTECTCESTKDTLTEQFSVDANTGVVTLSALDSAGGKSLKLTPTKADSSGGGISIALIAGIAGGAVVALLLLSGAVYFYRQQQQQQPGDYVDANEAFISNGGDAKARGGSHA